MIPLLLEMTKRLDCRYGTEISTLGREQDGPVYALDFHPQRSILASGGDQTNLLIWDYSSTIGGNTNNTALGGGGFKSYSLKGHSSPILSIRFHPNVKVFEWVVTGSEDHTMRIWNYSKRTCLSIIRKHTNHVTCVSFHPKVDILVMSASLDKTIYVWDVEKLKTKEEKLRDRDFKAIGRSFRKGGDVPVKYFMIGHEYGINFASFHPTLPLIVSAADGLELKFWRFDAKVASEKASLKGHGHNVTGCLFHPREKSMLSVSEDASIRVWDVSTKAAIQVFMKKGVRFWNLAAHERHNLFAAGHESGIIVFKVGEVY